jgi:hypothetical protein
VERQRRSIESTRAPPPPGVRRPVSRLGALTVLEQGRLGQTRLWSLRMDGLRAGCSAMTNGASVIVVSGHDASRLDGDFGVVDRHSACRGKCRRSLRSFSGSINSTVGASNTVRWVMFGSEIEIFVQRYELCMNRFGLHSKAFCA